MLLLTGHSQDQVRLRNQVAVAFEVSRNKVALSQVDINLAEHKARVERGEHTVAGVDGDTAGTDVDVVDPALG